jgi:phosphatidylserine synthase
VTHARLSNAMLKLENQYIPYVASALAGLGVCLAISIITGRKEAWDSSVYFFVGVPIMCALVFVISYLFPTHVWRWTLSMAVGQSLAIAAGGGSLNLWPLSIVAMTVVSIPQFVTGFVASLLSVRKRSA